MIYLRMCGCGGLSKVKVILLVCVFGLLANVMIFMKYRKLGPRTLFIASEQDAGVTSEPYTTVNAQIKTLTERPQSAGVISRDRSTAAAVPTASFAARSGHAVPAVPSAARSGHAVPAVPSAARSGHSVPAADPPVRAVPIAHAVVPATHAVAPVAPAVVPAAPAVVPAAPVVLAEKDKKPIAEAPSNSAQTNEENVKNAPLSEGLKLSDWRQQKRFMNQTLATAPPAPVPKVLPLCPEKSPDLVGRIATYLNPIQLPTVERKYPEVSKGGHYHPTECKAREKLAIIIPCRNREQHLYILLNNLLRMLIKQKLDFSIFVIDQEQPTIFNRGMLFNVGYLEALKRDKYDCFIFHDVDMIPTNDQCLYRCTFHPRHFIGGLSKWNYGLPYNSYYGGVVSFTREQYKKINGGSNLYFGWGGEDDDLHHRVLNKGYSMVRYPKVIGRYDTVSHGKDKGNKDNPSRFNLVRSAKARQDREGLNTAQYKVTEVSQHQLFTKIKVFINMTDILQRARAKGFMNFA